jgi:enoyl-CoA hydratase/carnithine racemase
MELMFMGELFSAEQAESWNIVNRVVPPESFNEEVDRYAQRIAGYSPAVLKLGKHALAKKEGMDLEGQLAFLQGLLSMNVMMDDAAEGISAFFEKRDPVWKGR